MFSVGKRGRDTIHRSVVWAMRECVVFHIWWVLFSWSVVAPAGYLLLCFYCFGVLSSLNHEIKLEFLFKKKSMCPGGVWRCTLLW